MRTLMFATIAALAAGLFNVAPASAAWTCTGPAFVCDDAKPAVTSSGKSYASKAQKSHKAVAYDDDKPAKKVSKPKKVAKAVSQDDDDKPVRKAKKSAGYSGGGESFSGKASYYWQPQQLASGGTFNPNAMTAAHKTLPFGTKVRVTNQHNGQSVVVTINDRGPYVAGRVIDLSKAAAHSINMQGAGVVPVSVAVLGR